MSGATPEPRLIAIAAMAENRIIGKDGKLPWHLPQDLKFFKQTTSGHAILFGKTTFEGLGRALPNRVNLVLSRSLLPREGIRILRDPGEIKQLDLPLVYICGGAEVYRQLFPICEELLLTRVKGNFDGDTLLPPFENLFSPAGTLEEGQEYRIERWLRNSPA